MKQSLLGPFFRLSNRRASNTEECDSVSYGNLVARSFTGTPVTVFRAETQTVLGRLMTSHERTPGPGAQGIALVFHRHLLNSFAYSLLPPPSLLRIETWSVRRLARRSAPAVKVAAFPQGSWPNLLLGIAAALSVLASLASGPLRRGLHLLKGPSTRALLAVQTRARTCLELPALGAVRLLRWLAGLQPNSKGSGPSMLEAQTRARIRACLDRELPGHGLRAQRRARVATTLSSLNLRVCATDAANATGTGTAAAVGACLAQRPLERPAAAPAYALRPLGLSKGGSESSLFSLSSSSGRCSRSAPRGSGGTSGGYSGSSSLSSNTFCLAAPESSHATASTHWGSPPAGGRGSVDSARISCDSGWEDPGSSAPLEGAPPVAVRLVPMVHRRVRARLYIFRALPDF